MARCFVFVSGLLLVVAAAAKIVSSFGITKALLTVDPVFGLSFSSLFRFVGSIELSLALICLFGRDILRMQLIFIGWLASALVIYRVGLQWGGYTTPCPCLGTLTDVLHISSQLADNIMKGVLAYLLIGSYGILLWQWKQGRAQKVEIGNQKLGI
jgi:hypothetical protein